MYDVLGVREGLKDKAFNACRSVRRSKRLELSKKSSYRANVELGSTQGQMYPARFSPSFGETRNTGHRALRSFHRRKASRSGHDRPWLHFRATGVFTWTWPYRDRKLELSRQGDVRTSPFVRVSRRRILYT